MLFTFCERFGHLQIGHRHAELHQVLELVHGANRIGLDELRRAGLAESGQHGDRGHVALRERGGDLWV